MHFYKPIILITLTRVVLKGERETLKDLLNTKKDVIDLRS